MAIGDYYETLGIERDASDADVKKASEASRSIPSVS